MSAVSRLPLYRWVAEGLRAGVLLAPRVGAAQPTAPQVLALVLVGALLDVLLDRFAIAGDAHFEPRGELLAWWNVGLVVLFAWALLPRARPAEPDSAADTPRGVAAWFALWVVALVPASAALQAVGIAQAQDWLPEGFDDMLWVPTLLAGLWLVAVTLKLTMRFGLGTAWAAVLTTLVAAAVVFGAWQFPDRPWVADTVAGADEDPPQQMALSQSTFEAQQAVWQQAVAQLAPQRPGVADVYGIVFSPYADDDVFLREGTMVSRLLEERFDARGRVLQLANHATTAEQLPWATPLNLERAIAAVGEKMDREHDLLIVYLTSHGANDFRLAASNPPLEVDPVSPGELRQALDNAGIRHRVIVVSACYSGGWVGPLADDDTLVMTAADATHTSFGCGSGSQLTFFGRAVFDEQLRGTHSFEQAFAKAVPVIRQREVEAGKEDGFSNPQMREGPKIRTVLHELETRLDAAGTAK